MHLELVNNTIRTKLDEIKRMEVQRLMELARIKMKSMSGTEVLHFIATRRGKLPFSSSPAPPSPLLLPSFLPSRWLLCSPLFAGWL